MDNSKKAVKVFNDNAKDYAHKYMNVAAYARSLNFFAEQLENTASLLDVACGPGNITNYLINRNTSFKLLGVDLSPEMLDIARVKNPLSKFQLLDMRSIKMLPEKYDGIICGFGMPYLSKEEALALIEDAIGLLHPKGLLYLSTMEDDYGKSRNVTSSSGQHELFMHFHEGGYLKKKIEDCGLTILFEERLEIEGSEAVDLVLIAGR